MKILFAVLVGAVVIYAGHGVTAEQIFLHLPPYLVAQYKAYVAQPGGDGMPPSYLIPEIGITMALQLSGIFWSFWGGLAAALAQPRNALLSAAILAGLLLPFWAVKALLVGHWTGIASYLAAAALALLGALLGRLLRWRAMRHAPA